VPADVNSLPLHPELAEEEGERGGSERTRESALKRSESRRSAPRASRASGAGPRAGSKERKTHLLYHSGAALRTPTPSRSSSETRTTSGAEVEMASTPTATGWGEVRVGRLDRASSHRHPERQHEQARAVGRRAAREMPTQRGRSAKRRVKRGAGPSDTRSGLAGRSARCRQLYVEPRALSYVYDAVEGEGGDEERSASGCGAYIVAGIDCGQETLVSTILVLLRVLLAPQRGGETHQLMQEMRRRGVRVLTSGRPGGTRDARRPREKTSGG